jgi:hypothetical protein
LERNMLRKMAFFAHFRPRFRGSVRENTFSGKSNLNLNLQMQERGLRLRGEPKNMKCTRIYEA